MMKKSRSSPRRFGSITGSAKRSLLLSVTEPPGKRIQIDIGVSIHSKVDHIRAEGETTTGVILKKFPVAGGARNFPFPNINSKCAVLGPAAGSENVLKIEELSGMRKNPKCVSGESPSGPVPVAFH
jgi:hypothetical protein